MAWWAKINERTLAQGDLLPDCLLPVFVEQPIPRADGEPAESDVKQARLIVVSQTCDLQNAKVEFVALCPIHTLSEFEDANPGIRQKGRWEKVRKGEQPALHLIASPDTPEDNQAALVIDFGHIVSVPFEYLTRHTESLGERWRLESPYLEHFSQAFARFFMRVGLPSSIAPFK